MTRVLRLELFREEESRKTNILIANEFDDLMFSLSDEMMEELVGQWESIQQAKQEGLSYFFEKNVVIKR